MTAHIVDDYLIVRKCNKCDYDTETSVCLLVCPQTPPRPLGVEPLNLVHRYI